MDDSLSQIQEDQKAALAVIQNAKSELTVILGNQEHVRIAVEAHLNRGANFLHGLTGTAPDSDGAPVAFGPMTSFMGEEIVRQEPVTATDLAPTDSEKEAFRAKRDELLATIEDREDDAVLAMLNQPQGEALLRNVARQAGVETYNDRSIDILYLADIRAGLGAKAVKADAVATGEQAKAEKADAYDEMKAIADQDKADDARAVQASVAEKTAAAKPKSK